MGRNQSYTSDKRLITKIIGGSKINLPKIPQPNEEMGKITEKLFFRE
jgi:hypothetical protein